MDERTEELLRGTLRREPQPELSPFFAARVANLAKAEVEAAPRRSHPVMVVYWGALLVSSIWFLGSALNSDLAYYLLLTAVPAGFALAIYWRQALFHCGGWMGRLFGQGTPLLVTVLIGGWLT